MAQATHCAKKRSQQTALKLTEAYNNSNGFPSNNKGSPRASLTQKGSIKRPMALYPAQKKREKNKYC
jgi:hypothetical protein